MITTKNNAQNDSIRGVFIKVITVYSLLETWYLFSKCDKLLLN